MLRVKQSESKFKDPDLLPSSSSSSRADDSSVDNMFQIWGFILHIILHRIPSLDMSSMLHDNYFML